MKIFIEPIGKLINEFTKLPGVGAKTAQRYAYKIINMPENEVKNFAKCLLDVKEKVNTAKFAATFRKTIFATFVKIEQAT